MMYDVKTKIIPILTSFEQDYVNDSYALSLKQAFDNLTKIYNNIDKAANTIANRFTQSADNTNKQRFYNAMERAVGVDVSTVIQSEGLNDILVSSTSENVSLIKSIPQEYFKKIESVVYGGTNQGSKAVSMIQQIRQIGNVTVNRARLIARDQTAKLNSTLNQQRQQNLGVTQYIWRTSGDGRVRETHKDNNGKVFNWDKPPKDTGHPGHDINCRCVAEPIIEL